MRADGILLCLDNYLMLILLSGRWSLFSSVTLIITAFLWEFFIT